MSLQPMRTRPRTIGRRELFAGAARHVSPYWVRIHRIAMACRFEVTLSGEDAAHAADAQRALAEAGRLDACLSVFRAASEISTVNRTAAERPVAVSRELYALLEQCHTLHARTEGTFDVTATPLSRCWGFLRREGRLPSHEAIETARAQVGMSAVRLDPDARTVSFTRPGIELNLGSIGKGYAVQRIARLLKRSGVTHALVSAGGSSAAALGGNGEWDIDLTSRRTSRRFARIRLRRGALATSGAGEQYVDAGGRRYGHVIDPRSGWPAQGLVSASAVTGDAATADALATAFLVGGEDLARRYCDAHPGTLAVLVHETDTARTVIVGAYRGVEVEEL